jgi:hypothetical protein
MPRKLKYTEQRVLARQVLEFIDWNLPRSDQQKIIDSLLDDLDNRMGRQRGPKIINTVQVMKFRADAMETIKNQIIAQTSGICDGSVATSFKRIQQQRQQEHLYRHYA